MELSFGLPTDERVPEETDDVDDEDAMPKRNQVEVDDLHARPDAVARQQHRREVSPQLLTDVGRRVAAQGAHDADEGGQIDGQEERLVGEHLEHGRRQARSGDEAVQLAVPEADDRGLVVTHQSSRQAVVLKINCVLVKPKPIFFAQRL